MILRSFTISNFLCFRDEVCVSFDHPLPSRNIYLIGGKNGQGKSSFQRALKVCLFGVEGKQPKIWEEINLSNKEAKKYTVSFQLDFMDEGRLSSLRRTYIPQSLSRDVPLFDMKLSLSEGGEKISEDSDEIQDRIEQLFPRDVSSFFLFDGEEIKELAERTDRGNAEQIRDSMELLLGLRFFKRLQDDLLYVRTNLARDMDATRKSEVEHLRADIARIDEDREQLEGRKRLLAQSRKQQEGRLDKTEREYFELGEASLQYQNLNKRRTELELKKQDVDKIIEADMNHVFAYALVADHIQAIINEADKEATQRLESRSRDKIRENLDRLCNELRAEYSCLCGRAMTEARYREIEDRLRTALLGADLEPDNPLEIYDLKREDLRKLQDHLSRVTQRQSLQNLCKQTHEIREELDRCHRELRTVADIEVRQKRYEELRQIRDEASREIGSIKNELSTISRRLEELPNQRETKVNELLEKTGQLAKGERARALTDMIQNTTSLIEDLAQEVRQDKIADLQKNVTRIFRRLWRKRDILDRIEVNPDSYETTIVETTGKQINKRGLSAGEKELFALSLLGGLALCAGCKPPVVIDTPLSRLDSEHRANIVREYYPDAGNQVILLATDTEITPDLYEQLQSNIRQTFTLHNDEKTHSTIVEAGFFGRDYV